MKHPANNQIDLLFNLSTLRIFRLFNNNHNYVNNIAGIRGKLNMTHQITRKYLTVLVDFGILTEIFKGKNGVKIFALNKDSSTTKAFIDFLDILGDNVI